MDSINNNLRNFKKFTHSIIVQDSWLILACIFSLSMLIMSLFQKKCKKINYGNNIVCKN